MGLLDEFKKYFALKGETLGKAEIVQLVGEATGVSPEKAPSFNLGAPATLKTYYGGPGTYTLNGVQGNYPDALNVFFWDGDAWDVLEVPIDIPVPENKIPDWVPGTYTTGQQVNHKGQLWAVKAGVATTTGEPGVGVNWVEKTEKASPRTIKTLTEPVTNTYTYKSDLDAAFPSGNNNLYLVTGDVKQVDTIDITSAPTSSGNITITLNGAALNIAIDSSLQNTPELVADKIRSTNRAGWLVSGSGTTVIFKYSESKPVTATIFNGGTTGVVATINPGSKELGTEGALVDGNWYYWDGSAWVVGGKYGFLAQSGGSGKTLQEIDETKLEKKQISRNLFNRNDPSNLIGFTMSGGVPSVPTISVNNLITHFIPVKEGRTYIKSANNANPVYFYDKYNRYTSRMNANNVAITIPKGIKYVTTVVSVAQIGNFQFEEGEIQTDYEEFQVLDADFILANLGSSDNSEPVELIGNIVDPSLEVFGVLLNSNGTPTGNQGALYNYSGYQAVLPNREYEVKGLEGTSRDIWFYDEFKNNRVSKVNVTFGTKFTTPSFAHFIAFNGVNSASTVHVGSIPIIGPMPTKPKLEQSYYSTRNIEYLFQKKYDLGTRFNDVKVSDFDDGVKTDSEIIDDCLAFLSGRSWTEKRLRIDKDVFIDRAILLESDTTLIIDRYILIKQKNEVFDNVIRGNNFVIDPANPYGMPLSVSPISNIKIVAMEGARIEGPDINKIGFHPYKNANESMLGDNWGWRTFQICFSLANNIEISGMIFTRTRGWAISFDRCYDLYLHHITFFSYVKNGDGIDFRSGCHNFKVHDIYGRTSDDTIALTALGRRVPRPLPDGNYLYTNEPTSYMNLDAPEAVLDIHTGSISRIFTYGTSQGTSTSLCASFGNQIYNIDINNLEEPFFGSRRATTLIYSAYGSGYNPNDIHDIRINGVVSRCGRTAVEILDKVENVWVNNVLQLTPEGTLHAIENMDGVTITNAKLDN